MDTNIEMDDFCAPPSSKEKIGQRLKNAREGQKITIDQVTKSLKIRPRLIRAIERADYEMLPDSTSLAALVKSYAIYLGLNGAALADDYRDEMKGLKKNVEINFPQMLPRYFKLSPFLLFLSFVAIFILYIVSFKKDLFQYTLPVIGNILFDHTDHSIPPLENNSLDPLLLKNTPSTDLLLEEAHQSLDDKTVMAFENKGLENELVIQAVHGTSWVQIKNKEQKILFSGILQQGKEKKITVSPDLIMDMGYAGALEFRFEGHQLKSFLSDQRVIRGFSLSPESLKSSYQQDKEIR